MNALEAVPSVDPEELARLFHETYERLAPDHGYRTRDASAVPWNEVPANNRALMVATCAEILPLLQCKRGHWVIYDGDDDDELSW